MVYAKIMLERGFIVGATRIFKRVWQLYAAYIVLFTIYIVAIGYVAAQYAAPDLINEFNVVGAVRPSAPDHGPQPVPASRRR